MNASRCVLLLTLACAACGDEVRRAPDATLGITELLGGADTLHARAVDERAFNFPRDHGAHPEFRSEWWYFTGNVTSDDGSELGYQLTFFRSALTDSASYARADTGDRSQWRARHAYMAHFAVTHAGANTFHAAEKFARGAVGLAGAELEPVRIWLEDWSAGSPSAAATFPLRLRAATADIAIDLVVERGKPVVLQGENGLSRKGPEPGNASYYYSLTRMPTRGSIRTGGTVHTVTGASWLDREWSTSALSPGVAGWDWMALQLDDSTELMMYRLRRDDGTVDAFSAATFIDEDAVSLRFDASEFTMTPVRIRRTADGIAYPVAWTIDIPSLDLTLDVSTPVADQELALAVRYWEGMVRARGTRSGRAVTARGYLEMTGYAGVPDGASR